MVAPDGAAQDGVPPHGPRLPRARPQRKRRLDVEGLQDGVTNVLDAHLLVMRPLGLCMRSESGEPHVLV